MSKKPENTFIGSVHKLLPPEVYRMKNNNPYLGGLADCWYSGSKADLWVEYKFIALPKRDDTVIDLVGGKTPALSALQQEWLAGRHAEGRNVAVIVGSQLGGVWLFGLSWGCTYTAGLFRSRLETRVGLARRICMVVEGR